MPFCSNCGAQVALGARFCPNCGTPQPQLQTAGPQPQATPAQQALAAPPVPPPVKARRPTWVTRLSRASLIAGILVAVFGVLFFLVPGSIAVALGSILLLLGVLSIAFRFGLKDARPWAKQLGFLTGIAYVAMGALQILTVTVVSVLVGVAFLAFGLLLLYYLRKPRAKEYLPS